MCVHFDHGFGSTVTLNFTVDHDTLWFSHSQYIRVSEWMVDKTFSHKAHYQAIEQNAELLFLLKHPETDGQDKRSALNKFSSDIQKSWRNKNSIMELFILICGLYMIGGLVLCITIDCLDTKTRELQRKTAPTIFDSK